MPGSETQAGEQMRRLIVSNLMSLDGFFEGPSQQLDWCVLDEEFFAYSEDMLRSVDTIVFGRVTYQHMAAYWPTAPKDEIADKMNNLPKIVFSRTLQKADWSNSRLLKGDAAEEIAKLKQQPGKDMVILGSATLASSLLQTGLIDEYRVILNPILIGAGHLLFKDIKDRIRLKLQGTKLLGSGVIVLYYRKA
jgi:dihydrofolate reductase